MTIVQAAATKRKLSLALTKELDEGLNEAINNTDVHQVRDLCNIVDYYYNHPDLVDTDAYSYIVNDMNWF